VCRGKLAGKSPDEIEVLKKAEGVWDPQVRHLTHRRHMAALAVIAF
jgi:hypothetical protein